MADVFSKEERRRVMQKVRSKDTKPELLVRKFLFAKGFRYRLHDKKLPGSPDVVLPKYKTVVFVQGCFWHGHPGCKRSDLPADNHEYWQAKIERNVARDTKNVAKLQESGWRVLTIWECQLSAKNRESTLDAIAKDIKGL